MESWWKATSVPQHHVVSAGMRSHGVPDVLVNVCPVIQSLHCPTLQQVLVPVTLLPQHSGQNVLWTGWDFHAHLPQPQGETIMHLEETAHVFGPCLEEPAGIQPLLEIFQCPNK